MSIDSQELKDEYQYFSAVFQEVSHYKPLEGLEELMSKSSEDKRQKLDDFDDSVHNAETGLCAYTTDILKDDAKIHLKHARGSLQDKKYGAVAKLNNMSSSEAEFFQPFIDQSLIVMEAVEAIELVNDLNNKKVDYDAIDDVIDRLNEIKQNIEDYGVSVSSDQMEDVEIKPAEMPKVFAEFQDHFKTASENKTLNLYERKAQQSMSRLRKPSK